MDPARQLPQLREGRLRLCRGFVETERDGGIAVRSKLASGEPQGKGQRHESLLRAIVEIALESLSLGVARCNDSRPRGADLLELRLHFSVEPVILDGESQRARNRCYETRIIEQRGI